MSLRCIIVEDEPLAVERLRDFVGRLPALQLVGTFNNAAAALSFLLENSIDILFLDIQLGGMSGLELLETAVLSCETVLTTANPDHALKAYDLRVADYLLKPFNFARFAQAVDRAKSRAETRPAVERDFIFVKTELRLERIALKDILYIEGDSDYRCIHTAQKDIMTLATFGELEQRLPAARICRVHKSYMVALDKIESVERDLIQLGKVSIPISATYRERFYSLIR